jgi:hypothetical protein
MPYCYGSVKESSELKSSGLTGNVKASEFKSDVTSALQATHKLQNTIKGVILYLNRAKPITAGPPNMFGSSVKIGMPDPTGTVTMGGYTPPNKGNMYFFANEIHKQVLTLIEEESSLPHNWPKDKNLDSYFAHIEKDMYDLEARDQYIQALVDSPSYDPKRSSLAFGREVLAMSADVDELSATLKSSKTKIDKDVQKSPAWKLAHKEQNWR